MSDNPVTREVRRIHPRVGIGHVHLKVADLERSLAFYRDVLGFELTQRYGKEAAFLSAGGYHHHLGLNTWAGQGVPPPPQGIAGLRHFTVEFPRSDDVTEVVSRLRAGGIAVTDGPQGTWTADQSQNRILLRMRPDPDSPRIS